jgi:alpha-2-macroglobulin
VYQDAFNRAIAVDSLAKGQQFSALVTVTNTSGIDLDQLALAHAFPSGWEIANERLAASATNGQESQQNGLTYEDIRDDRIHRFFNLAAGQRIAFRTQLTAAYSGRFCLPAITAEAMYQPEYQASTKGGYVRVR